MIGAYLANKPTGSALVYLVVAAILFGLAVLAAGVTATGRNGTAVAAWRALVAGGLVALVLAFLA